MAASFLTLTQTLTQTLTLSLSLSLSLRLSLSLTTGFAALSSLYKRQRLTRAPLDPLLLNSWLGGASPHPPSSTALALALALTLHPSHLA